MILHGYWRSTASYRVRIACNLKGVAIDSFFHDLRLGEQSSDAYAAINPQQLVPALATSTSILTQSLAIIEWLEEVHPEPPLLPADPDVRAAVRAMAATIACDIHPLNNLRVLNDLKARFGVGDDQIAAWTARWIEAGFAALEVQIGRHGTGFAVGVAPTMADCFLVPQVYSAERFKVDLTPFPKLQAVADRARAEPAFQAAHPDLQPDADRR